MDKTLRENPITKPYFSEKDIVKKKTYFSEKSLTKEYYSKKVEVRAGIRDSEQSSEKKIDPKKKSHAGIVAFDFWNENKNIPFPMILKLTFTYCYTSYDLKGLTISDHNLYLFSDNKEIKYDPKKGVIFQLTFKYVKEKINEMHIIAPSDSLSYEAIIGLIKFFTDLHYKAVKHCPCYRCICTKASAIEACKQNHDIKD